jgi:hypothetical protein
LEAGGQRGNACARVLAQQSDQFLVNIAHFGNIFWHFGQNSYCFDQKLLFSLWRSPSKLLGS